jgi:hypothetical protein
MSHQPQHQIDAVVANAKRLVAEAKEALAQTDRFFEEHGIDPRSSLETVRRHGGELAVQQVEAAVQAALREVTETVERDRVHGVKARAPGQRPPRVRSMI